MKPRYFHYDDFSRIRARPLNLQEVLRLRDGMKTSRNQPYQIKKITAKEKILIALN